MRFSSRVPSSLEPNAWAARLQSRRAAGERLIDLTEANPTRTGLAPRSVAEIWKGGALDGYAPDARGSEAARQAIAAYYAERGLEVEPGSLVLTASTSEAYAHLFRLLADPGETILVPRPSYPLFVPLARAEGAGVLSYRLAFDGAWHVDFDDLERAIGPRTRAVVVVQPNHPTGSCLDAAERAQLDALAARRGLAVISDEVFGDFPWHDAPEGAEDRPVRDGAGLPSLVGEREALTFVLSGLSKVCGLPQMKAAWIAVGGPRAARAPALERLEWLADLFLSVSSPSQLGLPEWLAGRHAFQREARGRIRRNLARLEQARRRAPALSLLRGVGGWVAVIRLPGRCSEQEWILELLDHNVVVHPGYFYDFELEPVVVVSLIVEEPSFDHGLTSLEQLVGSD